jgi:hypothetical protein
MGIAEKLTNHPPIPLGAPTCIPGLSHIIKAWSPGTIFSLLLTARLLPHVPFLTETLRTWEWVDSVVQWKKTQSWDRILTAPPSGQIELQCPYLENVNSNSSSRELRWNEWMHLLSSNHSNIFVIPSDGISGIFVNSGRKHVFDPSLTSEV